MSGELKKLTIEAYQTIEYNDNEKIDEEFVLMFNPATYSQKYEVVYEAAQGQGTTGSAQSFGRIKPQEYSFEFIFDGTGASSELKDVAREIEQFLKITGKLNSESHRPNFLKICWGNLISKCVLKSAEITYSLFKPDGYPLRAKVNATFSENIEDTLRTAEEGRRSPDLTHYLTVKEGDNLPFMCNRIYGDPSYYLQVARFNNLTDFRRLEEGAILRFPPLKK